MDHSPVFAVIGKVLEALPGNILEQRLPLDREVVGRGEGQVEPPPDVGHVVYPGVRRRGRRGLERSGEDGYRAEEG